MHADGELGESARCSLSQAVRTKLRHRHPDRLVKRVGMDRNLMRYAVEIGEGDSAAA